MLSTPEFKVSLFDQDGTLLDTDQLIRAAFKHTFDRRFGTKVENDDISIFLGRPLRECYQLIGAFYGLELDPRELEVCWGIHNEYQNANLHQAQAFPGVVDLLRDAQEAGIRTAIVTTRTGNGRLMVETAGLLPFIDRMVTGDDLMKLGLQFKPSPDAIQLVLNGWGISPTKSVMMGDTSVDIVSGQAAGVRTIGVTYGSGGHAIREAKPDYIISEVSQARPIILGES